MGPIQVVVEDGNNLVLEVTPTPSTTVILDRGIAGPVGPAGPGDVNGPASSTDNAIARFDGTTGKLIQNSVVTISDAGALAGVTDLSLSGSIILSGGTANAIPYLNGSKVLTTGSALTFDGTVLTNETGSGVFASRDNFNLRAYAGSTNATVVDINSAGTVGVTKFSINTSEQMRLTSTGLGIGTSSPSSPLTISKSSATAIEIPSGATYPLNAYGATTGSTQIAIANTGGTSYFGNESSSAGTTFSGTAAYATLLGTGAARSLQFVTNGAVRTTLDSSGNLGLGVTPSAWSGGFKVLEQGFGGNFIGGVNGAARLDTGINARFNGSNWIYVNSGATSTRYQQASGTHSWYTAPSGTAGNAISFTQAMTLDASGNLLVGTTNTDPTASTGIRNIYSATTPQIAVTISASSNNYILYSTAAAAYRFFVSDSGQIYATSTSISAISDRTLKENIRDLETGLREVMALKPRRFDWKNGDAQNVAGFVAQEVEEVLPELVLDYKYNETETKKSVKMGDILPTLVKAIQEQQAIITALTARVAALESSTLQ